MSFAFADRIPVEEISGLRPRRWLAVGPGFAREELKAILLKKGQGLVGEAVTSLQEIALRVLEVPADRMLSPSARQDLLRVLLAERRISAAMPELKKLRRQGGFFRKLDFSIQGARQAFAHPEEEAVYDERIAQKLGTAEIRPVAAEIRVLTRAYEAWLEAAELWDGPRALRAATVRLDEQGWPAERLRAPEAIDLFSVQTPESLERDFCDALGRRVGFERHGPAAGDYTLSVETTRPRWERWHTLDDAAERLAEALAETALAESLAEADLDAHAILIPDQASVRRTLYRALAARGLELADPRDPTRIRWDEAIKWALLPLEVVASRFERTSVIEWLRGYHATYEFPAWVTEINARGVREGLYSYSGGLLSGVHSRLLELEADLGGRRAGEELAEAHLRLLRAAVGTHDERLWILSFFERIWDDLSADSARLGQGVRRAPLLHWMERLATRIEEAPAPIEPLRPETGVRVYRLSQAPLSPVGKVWVLGLEPDWLAGEAAGDYRFSEREREVLSGEFQVRSGHQLREERLASLKAWLAGAGDVTFLDAHYSEDGRERETILPLLRDLFPDWPEELAEPEEMGAQSRWIASYGALRPIAPLVAELDPVPLGLGNSPPEISATAIDRYSRCGFQGLAYHRWKLKDVREPDAELWPEMRGNILHQAVKHLLESRTPAGAIELSPRDALERAWKEKPPKGMPKSARIEAHVRARMLAVLETFLAKEREYAARVGARPISLDNLRLSLAYDGFTIVGTPDRIDESESGIVIMDYKTSSGLPSGTEMMEQGYRLQLPFYALAAGRSMHRPVCGVQFVELNRKGGRSNGIFFKRYNGKEPGRLHNLRANSKSLLALEPEDAWSSLDAQLEAQARGYLSGRFEAKPRTARREKECASCPVADLCGLRRLSGETEGEP